MSVRRTALSVLAAAGLSLGVAAPASASTAAVHVTSKVTKMSVGAHGSYERTVFSKITGVSPAAGKKILANLNDMTLVATTPSGDQKPSQTELDDTVTLARADSRYITFHQIDYTFGWSAAHGITFDDPITFNRATGAQLVATDWIAKGDQAKFLTALSGYSRAWLKAHAETYATDPSFWTDGTKPTLDNFSSYEVTSKGWVIHFSQYQVASYAAGLIHVTVPWSKLAGLVSRPLPH